MTPLVKIQLSPNERRALEEMAASNYRRPSDELRFLLVSEAKRRGLLTDPPDPPSPRNEARECAKFSQDGGALPLVQP